MADSKPDVTHHVRLLPNGETPPLPVETGKHHELVFQVEGQEDPQAMTPEVAASEGGVSLPKLGEKFSVNPVMGSVTGSIAFPLPPGRTLTPSLGLGYDSNGENGPFGQGWALSVPYFQRATTRPHLGQSARGVPTYDDAAESDVFVFSDTAELVKVSTGAGPDGYTVTRYRPRLEAGFSRIERWEKAGISHWRVTSASNVVSLFGVEPASRVADPEDPTRVFRWNLCAQLDPLGNTLVYQYVTDTDVEPGRAAGCQSVLVRALYANKVSAASAFPMASEAQMLALCTAAPEDFLFEVLLDWEAEPGSGELPQDDPSAWLVRKDAFSFGRAGFEVRTRRLCRGVRVVHRLAGETLLVSRTELTYNTEHAAALLSTVEHVGIGDDGSELRAPAREFIYEVDGMKPTARALPAFEGLDLAKKKTNAEFIDLDGRAMAGLLVRHMGQFDYHRRVDAGSNAPPERLEFGVSASDSQDSHRQRFFDLDLDGRPALVELGPGGTGQVWERNEDDDGWKAGAVLPSVPPEADFDEETGFPRVLWGDLDGDGRTDALVVADQGEPAQVWRFEGLDRGWEPVDTRPMPLGAGGVLDDPDACVMLVDLSGDGLPDLVHFDHGALTVWPGLGHGAFGDAVSMGFPVASLPTRDGLEGPAVDPRRIRAFDIDGIGGADLLILEDGQARVLVQEPQEDGGGFTDIKKAFPIPAFEELGLSSLCRIEGRGTGSFVFAKKEANAVVTAVDFFPGAQGDIRQYVLGAEVGGIGLQTFFTYRPSTALEPSPEQASPIARLPQSVPVVVEVESYDLVAEVFSSSTIDYRHGCWDPREREFRGFGFVEQADAQELELMRARALARAEGKVSKRQFFDLEHALPRTFTRSWFHLGIVPPGGATLSELYATEYNQVYDSSVVSLPDPGDGDPEIVRALKGALLRSETYAEVRPEVELGSDEEKKAAAAEVAKRPLAIAVNGYAVKTVASGDAHRSVLLVAEQSLSYSYERKETPDPRVSHSAVLEVDDHGVPRKSIEVAYPRREAVAEPTLPLVPTDPFGPTDPDGEETGVRARLVGAMFEEAKSFVLPSALPGLRAAHAVHQERAGAEVVVVGHTDTEGQSHDNATLSLARARTTAALLRGDVSVWLAEYEGSGVGVWGPAEDAHMAVALGHDSIEAFADAGGGGELDEVRAALVAAYFEHAAASVPEGVSVRAVGAGEHFLAVPTPDSTPEPANRRVELFLFDTQAEPAPPNSHGLTPGDGVYEAWANGMTRTVSIDVATGEVDDPAGTLPPDAGPEQEPPAELISSDAPQDDPQLRTEVVRTEVVTVFDVDTPDHYRVGAVAETKSFAVPGQSGDSSAPFSMGALRAMGGGELLSHARTYFMDDTVTGPFGGAASGAPAGIGKTGIVHSSHEAAFTQAQFDAAFEGDALAKERLDSSPYVSDAGLFWAPSGTSEHDPDHFFLATRSLDVFGNAATVEYDADAYFAVAATDALGNTVRSEFDPRTLAATRVVDANGVQSHVRFDALGRVTKTWTVGVDGEGSSEDEPETRFEYDLEARPISVTAHTRHEHVTLRKHKRLPEPKASTHEHTTITYYSGSGGVLQTRTKVEGSRFRAAGQQHIGNKGHGVRTFDPSEGGPEYAVVTGTPVTTVRHDDLGRVIRVEYRDGSVERSEFDAWGQVSFDRNDTAQEEGYEGDLDAREIADLALHAGTSTHVRMDVLGRSYASFAELRDDTQRQMLSSRTHFDAAGNAFETIDAAGRVAEKCTFGLGGAPVERAQRRWRGCRRACPTLMAPFCTRVAGRWGRAMGRSLATTRCVGR